MKHLILFLALICGCVPTEYPQIYPNPNIGDDLSMPRRSTESMTFAEKNDFFIEGRNVEDVPTIMFGVRF